ncbi:hypothetical protein OKW35_007995 [Paraburkholderia sp. MM5477-R1]
MLPLLALAMAMQDETIASFGGESIWTIDVIANIVKCADAMIAIIWVGKADGQRTAFCYDPDVGQAARLSCTSTGHAWLMTMTDEQAAALVLKQGFGQPNEFGPNAPTTLRALLGFLHAARLRGYAMIDEVFAPRMSAVTTPVRLALRWRHQPGRSERTADRGKNTRVFGTAGRGGQ